MKESGSNELPGLRLADSIVVQREACDFLFAVLLMTATASFVFGNMLALDAGVAVRTAPVFAVCLAALCLLYSFARLSGSVAIASFFLCAGGWLFVFCRQSWLVWVCYAVLALGAIHTASSLRIKRSDWLLVLLLGLLGAAVAYSSSRLDSMFDMVGALESGRPAKDTLFHASLAAMIKNYGVVSTGLNGLVETPYYVMTHYLVAAVSTLSGRGVIEAIGVINLTTLIPLMLFSVVLVVAAVSPGIKIGQLARIWILACLLLVLLPWLFDRWHLSSFCFASESYVLSIALLLMVLPFFFLRRVGLMDLATIVAVTLVISYTKVSTALFIPGLAALRLVLLRTESKSRDAALFAASGGVVFYFLFFVAKTAESGGSHGFGLSRVLETIPFGPAWIEVAEALRAGEAPMTQSLLLAGAALLLYAVFHFVVSWVVLWVGVRQDGWRSLLRSPVGVYIGGSALAGLALSCVYYDYNNIGTYYFSNPSLFLALPFFCVWLAGLRWLSLRPEGLVLMAGVGVAALSCKSYYKYSRWGPIQTRDDQVAPVVQALAELRRSAPLQVTLRAAPGVAELALVKSRSTKPRAMPTANPFLFPAVSERPWTRVTGHRGTNRSENYISYSFFSYNMDRDSGQMLSEPVLVEGMSIREWEGAGSAR